MNEPFAPLLASVRRRLRAAWLAHIGSRTLAAGSAALLAVVLVGRWLSIAPIEFAAWCLLGATMFGLVVRAVMMSVPTVYAARACDRSLGTRDTIATAFEVAGRPSPGPLDPLVVERATRLAAGRRGRQIVHVAPPGRPTAAAIALLAAAVILSVVPSPADARDARGRALAAAVAQQAKLAEKLAREAADDARTPEQRALAESLAALAKTLQRERDPQKAERALDRAEADLLSRVDPDGLSKRAAISGLERSLADHPLPGANSSQTAAEQLESLARAQSTLSANQRGRAATQLEQAARSLSASHPELAAAMRRAAAALRSGKNAAAALRDAARLNREAVSSAVNQDRIAGALAITGQMRDALRAAQSAGSQGTNASGQQGGQQGGDSSDGSTAR